MEESTYRSAILSRENCVKFNSDPSGNRAAPKGRTIIHGTENSNSRTIGPTVQIVLQETKFCCGYHCSERITRHSEKGSAWRAFGFDLSPCRRRSARSIRLRMQGRLS